MSAVLAVPDSKIKTYSISDIARKSFSEIDPEYDLWLRIPREPEVWYDRFTQFIYLAPHERKILKVYNLERHSMDLPVRASLPQDWVLMSNAWRWKARASAFDEYRAAEKKRKEDEEKERAKARRINTLNAFTGKIEGAIQAFEPEEDFFRLSEITGALQMIGKESRAEFDQEPTKKSEVTITSMADLLRESERELGYGAHSNIIDADYR